MADVAETLWSNQLKMSGILPEPKNGQRRHFLSLDELQACLDGLEAASRKLDYAKAREILLRSVNEYNPSNGIDDLVWLRKTGTDTRVNKRSDRILDFPKKPT